jgi:DNA-binding NtrC family response regulator
MQRPCRLTYVGQDHAALAELTRRFAYGNLVVESIDPAASGSLDTTGDTTDELAPLELWPAEDWYRVVVLDFDVSTDAGLNLLSRMRAAHAGIPVIVVAEREGLRLTQQSLSWMHGADALVFKPLATAETLDDVVADAVRRLERWRETLACLHDRGQPAAV